MEKNVDEVKMKQLTELVISVPQVDRSDSGLTSLSMLELRFLLI